MRLAAPWNARRAFVTAVTALSIMAGCDEPPPPAVELARAVCDARPRCDCTEAVADDDCRSTTEEIFSTYVALPPETILTYDSACGATVVRAYEDLGCGSSADLSYDLSRGRVAECDRCKLYVGDKELGEACARIELTDYDDCAQGLFCFVDGDDPTAEGRCQSPCDTAGEGESCRERRCAEGLACSSTLGSQRCVRPVGDGEPCDEGTCGEGLVCGVLSHTCARAPRVGEACEGRCAEGGYCAPDDAGSFSCRAKKAQGAACLLSDECESGQCDLQAEVCRGVEPLVCSLRF